MMIARTMKRKPDRVKAVLHILTRKFKQFITIIYTQKPTCSNIIFAFLILLCREMCRHDDVMDNLVLGGATLASASAGRILLPSKVKTWQCVFEILKLFKFT